MTRAIGGLGLNPIRHRFERATAAAAGCADRRLLAWISTSSLGSSGA